jgi:hypothetical protein
MEALKRRSTHGATTAESKPTASTAALVAASAPEDGACVDDDDDAEDWDAEVGEARGLWGSDWLFVGDLGLLPFPFAWAWRAAALAAARRAGKEVERRATTAPS